MHGADAGGPRSNQFTDTYTKTIGVDFLEKALQVDALGRTVRLQLWDTAGQEEFDALTRSYYRGALLLCTQTADVFPEHLYAAGRATAAPGLCLLGVDAVRPGDS